MPWSCSSSEPFSELFFGSVVPYEKSMPFSKLPRRLSLLRAPFYPHSLQNWAPGQRLELDVVVGVAKIEHPRTLVSALVLRRLDDPVDRGFVISPREHLYGISAIDGL
jgi:hypothetical protein